MDDTIKKFAVGNTSSVEHNL